MISGVGNNYYLYEIFSGVGDIEINTNPSNQTRTIIYDKPQQRKNPAPLTYIQLLEKARESTTNTQAPALYQTPGIKRAPQPITPNRVPCATRRKEPPPREIHHPTDPTGNEASQIDKPRPDYWSSI
jgi:hypothetical protein